MLKWGNRPVRWAGWASIGEGGDSTMIDLSDAMWRKATYSGKDGNCVEVGDGCTGSVPVRDSKVPEGSALVFGDAAWSAFVETVQR